MRRDRRAVLGSIGTLLAAGCLGGQESPEGASGGSTPTASEEPATTGSTTGGSSTPEPTTEPTTEGTTGTGGNASVTPESALAWQSSFDADVSLGPAVAGDALYVGTADGNLHAVEFDGTVRWRTEVGGSFYTGPGQDESPIHADGTVYLASGEQTGGHGDDFAVHAVDAATGSRRWSSGEDYPSFLSLLAVAGGRVYTATSDDALSGEGETLTAHDAASGEALWTVEVGDAQAAGASDDAVAVADWGYLRVVDADGTVRWEDDELSEVAPRAPVFAGGTVLVATDRSANGLYALDPATGDRRWSYTDTFVNSLVAGDRAYVGGETVAAYGFDGSQTWDAGIQAFVETLHDETLYCARFSEGGGGGAVALSAADGTERWRHDVDAEIAEVVDADDAVAAVSLQGVPAVDGLDPSTGDRRFRLAGGDGRGPSDPSVHNGTTFVADGSTVYALV